MNPIALLQALQPAVRAAIYCIVWFASVVYGAYEAANGDWPKTLLAVIPALLGALAHANTSSADTGD